MKRLVLLLLLAGCIPEAHSSPPQVTTKAGTASPFALGVQGVTGGVPVNVSGSFSATTTGRATAAAPSYTEGTDNPLSIDLSGNIRTLATAETAAKATAADPSYTEGTTNPISQDLSGHLRTNASLPAGASTSAKQDTGNTSLASIDGKDFATQTTLALIKAKTDNIDVALSTRTKPADSQTVVGTFWPTTAAAPSSCRLSDGAAFYDGAKTGQLPAAIDGSGYLKVHEQGTATVDPSDRAARLLGVVYGSQAQQLKQTATNFNLQVELATGGTLYDARAIRPLTSSDVVSAAQSGTWTVQPGNTPNTTAWKVDGSAVTQPVSQAGTRSAANSSTANLGNGATFTGTYESVNGYAFITFSIFVDQVSATDGLKFDWSDDGSNADVTESSDVLASTGRAFAIVPRAQYFRVRYTNGVTPTTALRLGTVYHQNGTGIITKPADASFTTENFTEQTRSIIVGKDEAGSGFSNVHGATTTPSAGDVGMVVRNIPSGTQATNQTQINGVTVSVGQGVADTGTQRLLLAQKASYSATNVRTATAAGTGVFFNICGSGTKTIRLQYLQFDIQVATAAINSEVVLTKTSAATTAGTATTLTNVPSDANSAAATAAVKYYTALGTAGTVVGKVDLSSGLFPITASPRTTATVPIVFDYRNRQESETFTLRGTAQCVEAAFAVTTTNAPTMSVTAKWTEE